MWSITLFTLPKQTPISGELHFSCKTPHPLFHNKKPILTSRCVLSCCIRIFTYSVQFSTALIEQEGPSSLNIPQRIAPYLARLKGLPGGQWVMWTMEKWTSSLSLSLTFHLIELFVLFQSPQVKPRAAVVWSGMEALSHTFSTLIQRIPNPPVWVSTP